MKEKELESGAKRLIYSENAFSLVELSIVLVILGLLVGGILTGQSLIRAAELRSVTTEFQQYQTAVQTFRDRFFSIPGDMRNAEDFWGTMSSGTCPAATGGTGTQTCNGNGNGTLSSATAVSQSGEIFTFWQHLANAGLIEGSFTGIAGSGSNANVIIDENSPRARISNAGWTAVTRGTFSTGFQIDYGNTFQLGAQSATGTAFEDVLTPEEAWNIDTKVDDGMPGQGRVGPLNAVNTCSTAANVNDFDAEYALTNSAIACNVVFRRAF